MKNFNKEYWVDGAVEVEFVPGPLLAQLPVTAVGALAFSGPEHVVFTKNGRGWDNPGGHVEEGETALEALHREIDEEIGGKIVGEPVLVGHSIAREVRPHEWSHVYPPQAAIPVYFVRVRLSESFEPRLEVTDRKTLHVSEVRMHHHHWSPQRDDILAHAREAHGDFFADFNKV